MGYGGGLLNIKAGVGVCRELDQGKDKLVVIPKDSEEFEDNELVVIISATDFTNFTKEAEEIIKFMESIKELRENK